MIKSFDSEIKDLDETKGIVQMYVNSFDNVDSDGDISIKGSFKKTIKENFHRIKHLLNHDDRILLGLPLDMIEDDFGLLVTSQMNMKKQVVRDVFEDYRLFKEHSRTLEHSIRVNPIKRDVNEPQKVLEWRLWEYSTLYGWGANSETPLVDLKSRMEDLEFMLSKGRYSDKRFKELEAFYNILKNSIEPEALKKEPLPLNQGELIKSFYNKLKI